MMEIGHALGRWVIIRKDLAGEGPPERHPPIDGFTWSEAEPRDLEALIARGGKGRAHAETLDAADIALVARDSDGMVQHFLCGTMSTFNHPELSMPISVEPGEAFIYHAETWPPARGRGIARAVQIAMLHLLAERGVTAVWGHAIDRQVTLRRYCREQGFIDVGWMLSTAFGDRYYWTVVGERKFFDDDPLFEAPGLFVFEDQQTDVSRLIKGLDRVLDVLDATGEEVVLFGSGSTADELLTLVPGLIGRIAGVIDSNPRDQGARYAPTGHTILPPDEWPGLGCPNLLYASRAFGADMHEQHRALGPAGSKGIKIHPVVEVLDV